MRSIMTRKDKIRCAALAGALVLSLGGCVYAPPPAPAAYYDSGTGGYYPNYAYAPSYYYPYDYGYPYYYGAPIYGSIGGVYFGGRGRFR